MARRELFYSKVRWKPGRYDLVFFDPHCGFFPPFDTRIKPRLCTVCLLKYMQKCYAPEIIHAQFVRCYYYLD